MLFSGLFAGFAVGFLVALLQYGFVEQKILLAERYESHELVHFAGASSPVLDMSAHDQGTGVAASPLLRHGWTVLFASLIYVGYALVMAAGCGLAAQFGRRVTLQEGLLWGLAGFAACQMAPAMGLQPDLPGTMAADLDARQWWWLACALATAGGLALIGYGKGLMRVVGLVMLAAPHVIGAPELDGFTGVVPPELAASFAARSLGVGLVAWVTLGGTLAWLWNRLE